MSTKYSTLYGQASLSKSENKKISINNTEPIDEECDECNFHKEVNRKMREVRDATSPTDMFSFDQLKDLLKVTMHSSTRKLKRKPKKDTTKALDVQNNLSVQQKLRKTPIISANQ